MDNKLFEKYHSQTVRFVSNVQRGPQDHMIRVVYIDYPGNVRYAWFPMYVEKWRIPDIGMKYRCKAFDFYHCHQYIVYHTQKFKRKAIEKSKQT